MTKYNPDYIKRADMAGQDPGLVVRIPMNNTSRCKFTIKVNGEKFRCEENEGHIKSGKKHLVTDWTNHLLFQIRWSKEGDD